MAESTADAEKLRTALAGQLQQLLATADDRQAWFAVFHLVRRLRLLGVPNPLFGAPGFRAALVTATDSKFLPITEVLLASIPRGALAGALDLCILDVGLTEADAGRLRASGARLARPGWDIDFPDRDRAPEHYKAMVARPFVPRHFPGYHVYIYVDADAWIQIGTCLDDLALAALGGAIAVVPEVAPAYASHFRLSAEPDRDFSVVEWTRRAYRKYFDEAASRAYGDKPLINAGVHALGAKAPHWQAWAEAMARGLAKVSDMELSQSFTEQTALNYAIYHERLAHQLLPATYNWLRHRAEPLVDPASGRLCEPTLPHRPIQILHLTGPDKTGTRPLTCLDGRVIERPLASFFRQESEEEAETS